jgi:hypothetical protein
MCKWVDFGSTKTSFLSARLIDGDLLKRGKLWVMTVPRSCAHATSRPRRCQFPDDATSWAREVAEPPDIAFRLDRILPSHEHAERAIRAGRAKGGEAVAKKKASKKKKR